MGTWRAACRPWLPSAPLGPRRLPDHHRSLEPDPHSDEKRSIAAGSGEQGLIGFALRHDLLPYDGGTPGQVTAEKEVSAEHELIAGAHTPGKASPNIAMDVATIARFQPDELDLGQ